MNPSYTKFTLIIILLCLFFLACRPGFLVGSVPTPTATPTKTPTSPSTPTPTLTLTFTPPPPTPTKTPTPMPPTPTPPPSPTEEPTAVPEPPTDTPVPVQPETPPTEVPTDTAATTPTGEAATTESASPEDKAYKIVHYKVLGEGENNGGIFNKGGQHLIFLTVLDENGQGLDGAVVKDANGSKLEVVTGSKGPGKAEILMEWEPYRLYVATDPNGPTTSEVSNQMNTAYPNIPDIVGKLGSIDNEYSVCPTAEIRCTPPFYSVHFSYEITFQKAK